MFFSSQNFVAANQFCFRVCQDSAQAPALCNHIYDTQGCAWNMPGDYGTGFTSCRGDDDQVRVVLQFPLAKQLTSPSLWAKPTLHRRRQAARPVRRSVTQLALPPRRRLL